MRRHRQPFVGKWGSCFATAIACVLDMDLAEVPNFVAFGDRGWFEALILWAKARRVHVKIIHHGQNPKYGKVPARGPYVASGTSPRGWKHSVVFERGKFAHDPYPGDEGLVGDPTHYWKLWRCTRKRCKACGVKKAA